MFKGIWRYFKKFYYLSFKVYKSFLFICQASILIFTVQTKLFADSIPEQYISPLGIPLQISGNFGDIRSGSFHFGIDYTTNGITGYPVFAVADGYVSRIKVEPGGYGRAIYISHPNGITSVYGHLEALQKKFDDFIKNEQYKNQHFFIDYFFEPGQFPVKQGDTIAFTGNAGYSSGPHLHFEIRDSKTQNTLNPFIANVPIIDNYKPVIKSLWVYANTGISTEVPQTHIEIPVIGNDGTYRLKNDSVTILPNYAGIGIEAFDEITDSFRKLSWYSAEMFVDTTLWFNITFDEMSFTEVNYVNSSIDIEEKNLTNENVYKMFLWPNQEMIAYKQQIDKGWISFNDSLSHKIKIIIADIHGNKSELNFFARKSSNPFYCSIPETSYGKYFLPYNSKNIITEHEFSFIFPENSLYQDACLNTEVVKITNRNFFRFVKIGDDNILLKKAISVNVKVQKFPGEIKKKLVIIKLNKNGSESSIGGTLTGNLLSANAKSLGTFSVMPDTIKPIIREINISNRKNMKNETNIKIKISDDLSGIAEYKGLIDNQWVLFEFDAKNNLLCYTFDSTRFKSTNTKHKLLLTVTDKVGNKSTYRCVFIK
jgi:murein DD-endopeptidase MepM/ murein hydrolase activator NlpD